MTGSDDERWKQRFGNYRKALSQLSEFDRKSALSKMEQQGFIKSFEYTFELSWTVLKDFFEAQGEARLLGSRDAYRLAFRRGMIREGETWMDMIRSRIMTAHTYYEAAAAEVVKAIRERYLPLFNDLAETLERQLRVE